MATKKIAKKAGLAVFAKHMDNYTPSDPYYEVYTDKKGREKRRRRDIPPGLSERDSRILKSVNRRAHHLDRGFSLCGFRFGWTFLLSLIPLVGDVTDAFLNYRLVVCKAKQADIPAWLLRKMLFNNAVSAGLSFFPVVGDILLGVWKANSRNAALLEEFLRIRGEEFLKGGEHGTGKVNESEVKPGDGRKLGEKVAKVASTSEPLPADAKLIAVEGGDQPAASGSGSKSVKDTSRKQK